MTTEEKNEQQLERRHLEANSKALQEDWKKAKS